MPAAPLRPSALLLPLFLPACALPGGRVVGVVPAGPSGASVVSVAASGDAAVLLRVDGKLRGGGSAAAADQRRGVYYASLHAVLPKGAEPADTLVEVDVAAAAVRRVREGVPRMAALAHDGGGDALYGVAKCPGPPPPHPPFDCALPLSQRANCPGRPPHDFPNASACGAWGCCWDGYDNWCWAPKGSPPAVQYCVLSFAQQSLEPRVLARLPAGWGLLAGLPAALDAAGGIYYIWGLRGLQEAGVFGVRLSDGSVAAMGRRPYLPSRASIFSVFSGTAPGGLLALARDPCRGCGYYIARIDPASANITARHPYALCGNATATVQAAGGGFSGPAGVVGVVFGVFTASGGLRDDLALWDAAGVEPPVLLRGLNASQRITNLQYMLV